MPDFYGYGKPSKKTLISLTSSPERIKKGIFATFSTIHPETHKILNLPRLYRNSYPYDVDDIKKLEQIPNLKINWISYDYGPQTKLLGAFEYDDILKYENIIVIDDDTIYSKHLIEQYEINFQDIQKTVYSPGSKKIFGIRMQEGWKSYGFKIKDLMDHKKEFLYLVKKYLALNASCKMHDDLVFGAAFEDLGFSFKKVNLRLPQQLLIGYSSDALHIQETGFSKHLKCSKAILDSREICLINET